jgi:hypothetical protein
MKKIYTFRGRKCENEPAEPKNGIWGPKSVFSCGISIDREFNMEHEKIYFWGSKRQKLAPRVQKWNLGPKIRMVVSYIHRTGISHEAKKIYFGGSKRQKV